MKLKHIFIGALLLIIGTHQSIYYLPIILITLCYLIARRNFILSKGEISAITPLLLMLFSGAIFMGSHDFSDAIKDIWYVGKIIVIFLVGILIGHSSYEDHRWLRAAAICCFMAASVNLAVFFTLVIAGKDARISVDMGYIVIISFFLVQSLNLRKRSILPDMIIAAPIFLAVILSASRTTLLVFLFAWLGARGVYQSRSKLAICAFLLTVILLIFVPMLPQYDLGRLTFLGKVQNSINELMFVSGDDMMEVTANWRGFEAFKAYKMWQEGSIVEQILGRGLGTLVDIGFYYELLDGYSVRYLPILHNAYFTVLVKFGVLGVVLFIVFMSWPIWLRYQPSDPQSVIAKRLGVTTSVILLVTTISVSGPLNKAIADSILLLMGWSIGMQVQCYRQRRLRDVEAFYVDTDAAFLRYSHTLSSLLKV